MAIKRHKPATESPVDIWIQEDRTAELSSHDKGWIGQPVGQSITKPADRTQLNILINQLLEHGRSIVSGDMSATITTEDNATLAASLGSSSRRIRKFVTELLDPGIAKQKKLLDELKEDKKNCLAPLDRLESSLSIALGAYNSELAARAAEQKRLQEQSVFSRVEQSVMGEAQELIDSGRIVEAEQLVASVPDMIQEISSSLPQTSKPIPKLAGSVGRESYTYTLLDINKVNREVLISALTRTATGRSALESTIKKLLDEHGEGAIELVGRGSIEISPVNKVHFRA